MKNDNPLSSKETWGTLPQVSNVDDMSRLFMAFLEGDPIPNVQSKFTNVLLTAQQKSASLYLFTFFSSVYNIQMYGVGRNKFHGITYYPRIIAAKFLNKDTISHVHATAAELLPFIEVMGFKVIVLWRNILDTIVSHRDMYKEGIEPFRGHAFCCQGLPRDAFMNATEEDQFNFIINFYGPQYFVFYKSWTWVREHRPDLPVCFITYEEMIADKAMMTRKVAETLGLDFSAKRYAQAHINTGKVNFNKGIAGRGKQMLSENNIENLLRLATSMGVTDKDYLGIS